MVRLKDGCAPCPMDGVSSRHGPIVGSLIEREFPNEGQPFGGDEMMNRDQCAARIAAVIDDMRDDATPEVIGCVSLLLAVLSALKDPDVQEVSRLVWGLLDARRGVPGPAGLSGGPTHPAGAGAGAGPSACDREQLPPGERMSDLRFRLLVHKFDREALRYRLQQQRLSIGAQRSRIHRQLASCGPGPAD